MVGINAEVHALRATAVTNALVPRCRYRQGAGVAGARQHCYNAAL